MSLELEWIADPDIINNRFSEIRISSIVQSSGKRTEESRLVEHEPVTFFPARVKHLDADIKPQHKEREVKAQSEAGADP